MAYYNTMAPGFKPLFKADGHLGALYNPHTNVLRLVCRAGTTEYELTVLAEQEIWYSNKVMAQEQEQAK